VSVSGAPRTSSESGDTSRGYSLVAIPPQPFEKYTLIGKLGHGGMAEVNLAVVEGKSNFRKLVVVKRLHPHLAAEPGFVDMFLDEARLAARLNHPHCVQTHEVGEFEGSHFLAMEYLDGQGLERLLRMSGQKGEPIPFDVAARIVSDCLDGLAYAHELTDFDGTPLAVVHRDVSPQNIFITYNGMVKLLDFGIAKAATHVVETRTGVIKGKYAYIAPEQALAQEVDHRADLWSMGVVLWEVLTGRRLFKSINELATLHETLQGEIKPPSTFRAELPPELDRICLKALERDVNARYQSAQAMKEDLDRFLATLPKNPGRKQIARLMQDRFESVIETHKLTLAQCLKGGAPGLSVSGIQRLVEAPVTQSSPGMTPTPGFTPTPSSSGAFAAAPISGVMAGVQPTPEKKSGLGWKIGLVLLVALLAGVAALVIPLGSGDEDTTQVAQGPGTPPDVPPTRSAPVEPSTPVDPVPTNTAPAQDPAPNPTPTAGEPATADVPTATPTTPQPSPTATTTGRDDRDSSSRDRRRRSGSSETASTPTPNPAPTPAPSAPEAPAETGTGYLTLATTPWTRVRLGSRDLGTTPLIRVEIPAGSHTLHLSNPEQGIEQTYRFTIRAGETVTRRLGLE
jgi:serine/threonine-protein kinase